MPKNNILKRISWLKVIGVVCIFFFFTELFLIIELFKLKVLNSFNGWNILISLIVYSGALLTIINIIPKDYILKENKKNAKN